MKMYRAKLKARQQRYATFQAVKRISYEDEELGNHHRARHIKEAALKSYQKNEENKE